MLEYLINYGVSKKDFDIDDIDIEDKAVLESQINKCRKKISEYIVLKDSVQAKYIEVCRKISNKSKAIIESLESPSMKSNAFATDEEYLELDAEKEAYKISIGMIDNMINFYQTDLQVLRSTFYSKF